MSGARTVAVGVAAFAAAAAIAPASTAIRTVRIAAPHGILRAAVANDDPTNEILCRFHLVGNAALVTFYRDQAVRPVSGRRTNERRDVAMLDAAGTVVSAEANVQADAVVGGPPRRLLQTDAGFTSAPPDAGTGSVRASAVLETAPGALREDGIVVGTVLARPHVAVARIDDTVRPSCRRDIK